MADLGGADLLKWRVFIWISFIRQKWYNIISIGPSLCKNAYHVGIQRNKSKLGLFYSLILTDQNYTSPVQVKIIKHQICYECNKNQKKHVYLSNSWTYCNQTFYKDKLTLSQRFDYNKLLICFI